MICRWRKGPTAAVRSDQHMFSCPTGSAWRVCCWVLIRFGGSQSVAIKICFRHIIAHYCVRTKYPVRKKPGDKKNVPGVPA